MIDRIQYWRKIDRVSDRIIEEWQAEDTSITQKLDEMIFEGMHNLVDLVGKPETLIHSNQKTYRIVWADTIDWDYTRQNRYGQAFDRILDAVTYELVRGDLQQDVTEKLEVICNAE